jgi:hydroxypyruvate reductase
MLASEGIIVTNHENVREIPEFEVIGAGHPLPDANGLKGARAVADRVKKAQAEDLVLVLISGGGSALLPYPPESVSLDDKVATTELLLACGADIGQINTVRKHLSVLKGGGLAKLAAPASVHALILSDVIGDDLSAIASGPTVPDPTTYAQAIEILKNKGVWENIPESVRTRLQKGCAGELPETPKLNDPVFSKVANTLVGSNSISLQAMKAAAVHEGCSARIYSTALCGEARDEAQELAEVMAREVKIDEPLALLSGGETTVTLRGAGRGGRNQEMALAFAIAAEKHKLMARQWVFLSGGTDGRDGPTDAAGAIVDPWTLARIRESGQDPVELLQANDSYHALDESGDLLRIGATGTNVADLQILLLAV